MDFTDMGLVYQYLLKNRTAESKPSNQRRARKGEPEVVSILRSCDMDDFLSFNEFLGAQGLKIEHCSDLDYPGIPIGGHIWMLVRDQEGIAPDFLSSKRIYEEIRLRDTESIESANVWFMHIWLMYLSIIYTRQGRGVSQISEYMNAFLYESQLVEAVTEHIEEARRHGINPQKSKVMAILDDESGADVPRRVKSFLSLMCESGLLIRIDTGEYQQTLLGAIELAQGFERSIGHYVNLDEDVLDNVVNVVSPTNQDEMEYEDNKEGDDVTD
jgi:hypothetical protein